MLGGTTRFFLRVRVTYRTETGHSKRLYDASEGRNSSQRVTDDVHGEVSESRTRGVRIRRMSSVSEQKDARGSERKTRSQIRRTITYRKRGS